jgi:hypothetical protein
MENQTNSENLLFQESNVLSGNYQEKVECKMCMKSTKFLIKKLQCGHNFHHSCLSKYWLINHPEKMKQCPTCQLTSNLNETFTNYRNIPDFYKNILHIHREQCSHVFQNGIQCKNYEYPWRMGKCKQHAVVEFHPIAEKNIITCFESSLYIHNFYTIKLILKLHFLIQFFLIRSNLVPHLYSNKMNTAIDMSEIMKKYNNIILLYMDNNLVLNNEILHSMSLKIHFQ